MSYIPAEKLHQDAINIARDLKPDELKPKDRISLPRQEMPSQDPNVRKSNMNEVALGYFEEQVRIEAQRCLQCKTAPCVSGCPVQIDIPGFIKAAAEGDYEKVPLHNQAHQPSARHLRPRLPPGGSVSAAL